ncbi:UDP-4-amino-4,6-dideoxy-N-acetyl-beta-L-altrosamine transaminase [Deltaproteobacteria bacterium OttesenSCG-928-K17]|nr:UDP-4-amino-4,6-dideoxy-N-acetyl-beta-L-altrosamine transaminase [Deltaproteobacteria bacterium OttesenSCG-928-K17]
MIPYGRQEITDSDVQAVEEILRSDWLTQGPAVPRFESAVAAKVGAARAVAVNSATSALHLACLALGLGPGGRLWTSPNTFVASANCARYCGAEVDFVDIDPRSYNMSPEALAAKLEAAQKSGRLPDIVVPVHFAGQSCEMETIADLARQYGFKIIEDASHAVGGSYKGEPVGCCRFSDITVFSFHPVKIITTAEGGMAVTNDQALADRMAGLRSHGITREAELMNRPPDGPWYYQQLELGFNYRLTDIQAALGLSQLARLNHYVERRHQLAGRYNLILADLPLTLPWQSPDSHSAFHLYPIRVKKRDKVFGHLRACGIGVNVHYIPVHTQPYYQALGFAPGDFPEAEKYYDETLSLPLFPALTEAEQNKVRDALAEALADEFT